MTPTEKAKALLAKVRDESPSPPTPDRAALWAAMPPEMQADLKAIGQAFGRFQLKSLTIDGEKLR